MSPSGGSENCNKMADAGPEPENKGQEEETFGCKHYRRRCAFLTPCCDKIYSCRLCHDDNEGHAIDRRTIVKIKCLKCNTIQPVGKTCTDCAVEFSRYFCPHCRLYDDEDKDQFHCDGCGICRVGGRENFFHCERCDLCLAMSMKDSHKCVERASRGNCPVCMEYLHTSREPCYIPSCGHLLHEKCFKGMLNTGIYACALCSQSMVDMKSYWKSLEQEVENTPMPEEYRNMKVWVLCRDCHKETKTQFHVCGLKCMNCGSFNTARAADRKDGEGGGGGGGGGEGAEGGTNSEPAEGASNNEG